MVERGKHVSASNPAASAAYQEAINEKLARGQTKAVICETAETTL